MTFEGSTGAVAAAIITVAAPRYTEPANRSTIPLNAWPPESVLREKDWWIEQLFVSANLKCVRGGVAAYEIPDKIHVRFRDGQTLRDDAPFEPAIHLTVEVYEQLVDQFDASPASADPVMRARMQRPFAPPTPGNRPQTTQGAAAGDTERS